MIVEYSAAVKSTVGFLIFVPTLFIRILSFPLKMEETFSINCSRWARSDPSQTEPVTAKPLACHSRKHLSSSASFREQVCTVEPSPASSSTTAYPIPRVPPVTRAVVPLRDHTHKNESQSHLSPPSLCHICIFGHVHASLSSKQP